MGKDPPANKKAQVQSLGREDRLEEGMSTHSSVLAWRIPWTEEPGGLQSMRPQRVWHGGRLSRDKAQEEYPDREGSMILRNTGVCSEVWCSFGSGLWTCGVLASLRAA